MGIITIITKPPSHWQIPRTASTTHEHLDGSLGSQIALHHVQQALGSVDVHKQCCIAAQHLCFGVELPHRTHVVCGVWLCVSVQSNDELFEVVRRDVGSADDGYDDDDQEECVQ